MPSWKSPDGFTDEGSVWSDETLAYDGDTGTYAYVAQNGNMWCQWCRFSYATPVVDATKLRLWASHAADARLGTVDIHLYDTLGAYQSLYQSGITHDQYVEIAGATTTPLDFIRIRFEGGSVQYGNLYLNEIAMWSPDIPTVISATPNSLKRTENDDIVLAGTYLTGATVVDFGADITVNSFIVNSSIQITANITVGAGAALGARDVDVTTPDGVANLSLGFTVNAAPAVVYTQGTYSPRNTSFRGGL